MKIKKLQEYLTSKKINNALFFSLEEKPNPNFFYFSNFEGNGAFLIPAKGKPYMIVHDMERETKSDFKKVIYGKSIFDKIPESGKIAVDKNSLSVNMLKKIKKETKAKLFDISKVCFQLRKQKTEAEIRKIRKACKITDNIFNELVENFKKFKTDNDVFMFLNERTIKNNCRPSFEPVIASGTDSSQPHCRVKGKKLKKGFCIIDFGVKYEGYCSDLTRTIYLGEPNQTEVEAYNIVLDAQKKALQMVKSGTKCSNIDKKVREIFGKHKNQFIHSTGHGIGVEVHESPSISPKSKSKLADGMTIAIEPGLYFKGKFGIRIEDDVLVKGKNPEILTKATKQLIKL